MKISLNSKLISGPYGGGMQFAKYLEDFLLAKNIEVVKDLRDDNIDIILHINPFPFLMKASAFSFFDAYLYKMRYPKTIIIQRVNECDERKGTGYMNKLLIKVSNYSDFIIFISSWLKPLLEKSGLSRNMPSGVIFNGVDTRIFNRENKKNWNKKERLKIVTHHWAKNYLKGHDVYQKLDNLLEKKEFRNKFEFTFIGNYPDDLTYKNTKIIRPLSDKKLANELKKHHIYITASRNEPGGMHHIEGALCGLPLLYINSGALPEYCGNYGLRFNINNLEEKLNEMARTYDFWLEKIKSYNNTAEKMATDYYNLFRELYKGRDKFEFKRETWAKYKFHYLYLKIYSIYYAYFWKIKRYFLLTY